MTLLGMRERIAATEPGAKRLILPTIQRRTAGSFWTAMQPTADGVYDYFGRLNFNISSDETEWTGIVRQHPDWGGKTGRGIAATIKVTRSSPTATTFTVTAAGVSQTGMISKHELFWSELNSKNCTRWIPLRQPAGAEGVIAKSYDIRDKELPSGTTINVYAKATDKYGNYTVPNLLLGTVDIPNYVTPQAPQLSVYNGDQYYTMGQEPLFPSEIQRPFAGTSKGFGKRF